MTTPLTHAPFDSGVPESARDFSVDKRVVIVTGAAQGLGREFARQFAAAGAVAVVADLDVAKAFSGAANHVQFILGRHFCVGSLLARTEMQVALELVLDSMPNLRFQEGFVPKEVGLYTRSVESLLVEFDVPSAA